MRGVCKVQWKVGDREIGIGHGQRTAAEGEDDALADGLHFGM